MATLGSRALGDSVYIKEGYSWVEYLPIIHNYPEYGRTLVMRYQALHETQFHVYTSGRVNDYRNCYVDEYLEGDFYNNLDPYIQSNIAYVTIGFNRFNTSAPSTISRRVFSLSRPELGYNAVYGGGEGSEIPYLTQNNFAGMRDFWTRSAGNDDDAQTAFAAIPDTEASGFNDGLGFRCVSRDAIKYGNTPDGTYCLPCFTLPNSISVSSDGKIQENQSPTTPSSISFGTPYAGKSLSVSCGASSDPDGDTITYVFERQIDSGAWTQISATTSRSITTTCPSSGSRVNFRVKARDKQNNESNYRTGTAKTIIYNTAPPAPASITYGDPFASSNLEISCATVTDPDGDPVTYVFERQVDSGGWTQLSATTENTVTDIVPNVGTNYTVRVKARDTSNAESAYTTGETKPITYTLTLTDPGKPMYKYPVSNNQMRIKWNPAAAPGGKVITYSIEQNLDNTTWTPVTTTTETSYLLTVPNVTGTGSTIKIRIKASDPDGNESNYVEGDELEILWHKVSKLVSWTVGTAFKARQFTLNDRKQYQTKLEGAYASETADPDFVPLEDFGDNSPAQIEVAIKNGTYKTMWSVGDTITIPFSDGNYIFRIADFDHDQITSDSRKAAITLELKDLLTLTYQWNEAGTNAGGYPASSLSDILEGSLYDSLPDEWKRIIVPVDKTLNVGGQTASIDNVSLKIFPPSEVEVFGIGSSSSGDEGEQYSLYATSVNRVKMLSNGGGETADWWTSSPSVSSATAACAVDTDGNATVGEVNTQKGVCVMFCIGYGAESVQ